jgi:hypothetical protein
MLSMSRNDVIAKNRMRLAAQGNLVKQIATARRGLSPSAIWLRFINSKREQVETASQDAVRFANRNAWWIIGGGVASILIALRLPMKKRTNKRVGPDHVEHVKTDERP